MKGFIPLAGLLLLGTVHLAAAQEPTASEPGAREEAEQVLEQSGITEAIDSIAEASGPELREALEELSAALGGLVTRVANDPELRRSALEAAQGMVGIAQVVIAEQSEVIQDVLRTAADELEELPVPDAEARDRR